MSFIDQQIQDYLDAIADPRAFCNGFVSDLEPATGAFDGKPDCEVRDSCPLFRATPGGRGPVKLWRGSGTRSEGCDPFAWWEDEKRRQEEDSREWVVTMAGVTRTVCGRDPLSAAVRMFFELNNEGVNVDKSVLLDRTYSVREK